MIAIDMIGEPDDVCVDRLAHTLAHAIAAGTDTVVHVDGLDRPSDDFVRKLAATIRKVRVAGRSCAIAARDRRMRTSFERAGCGDLIVRSREPATPQRRVIIARHLAGTRTL